MELDDMLANMLDSLEQENTWDAEVYAKQALDYLNDSENLIGKEVDRGELISYVQNVYFMAQQSQAAKRNREKLLDDVMKSTNQKRIRLNK